MSAVATPHRWTLRQYEQMVRLGIFDPDQRVELMDGEVIDMAPQNEPHAVALTLVDRALRRIYGEGYVVRIQSPMALDDRSAPEPDIAIVLGEPRDFLTSHPRTAVLIVEVADTTLSYDRSTKLAVYGRNQVPEYWIVNLVEEALEVYRRPQGAAYAEHLHLRKGQIVTVTNRGIAVKVEDILP